MTAFASPRRLARLHPRAGIRRRHGWGSLLFGAVGLANDQYARPVADNEIASTAVLADCRGFVGTIARIVLLDGSIRCNEAFPYGFASPISTSVYYPADIAASDAKLPVITFVGGTFQRRQLSRTDETVGQPRLHRGDLLRLHQFLPADARPRHP